MSQPMGPLPPKRVLDRHIPTGITLSGYSKEDTLAYAEQEVAAAVMLERERWQRIAENAQAVTNGSDDKIDYFEVPSHLMAALALALDDAAAAIRAKDTP